MDERFALSLASTLSAEGQRGARALPKSSAFEAADAERGVEAPAAELHQSRAAPLAERGSCANQPVQVEERAAADRDHQYTDTGHDRTAASAALADAAVTNGSTGEPDQALSARVRAQSAASMAVFERPPRREPNQEALTGPPGQLHARVRVRMEVKLTPPLTAVPG